MRSTTWRMMMRVGMAAIMVAALAAPAFTTSALAAEADDDIATAPAIPASSFTGMLTADVDAHDVYSIALSDGESLVVTLTADPGTDFDLRLWPSDAVSVNGAVAPIAEAASGGYPEVLTYYVAVPGTYYLDVDAFEGAGEYTIEYAAKLGRVQPSDDNITTTRSLVPTQSGSINDTVDDVLDADDCFRVRLEPGDRFEAALTAPDLDNQFELFLFSPGAGDIHLADPIRYSTNLSYPQIVRYTAVTAGDYLIDVHGLFGYGAYTLSWSVVSGQPIEGNNDIAVSDVLPASPASDKLDQYDDPRDVYRKSLLAGQSLVMTLSPEPGTDFALDIYGPNTGSVLSAMPSGTADATGSVRVMRYQATVDGDHYVCVKTTDSDGAYALDWSVVGASVDITNSIPATVARGKSAVLVSHITRQFDGMPLVGKTLVVEQRPAGGVWAQMTQVVSDATGKATWTVYPSKLTDYRMRFAGDADYLPLPASTPARCTPFAYLTTPMTAYTSYRAGAKVPVGGSLKPHSHAVRINAYRWQKLSNGSYGWVSRTGAWSKVVSKGTYYRYTATVPLPYTGKWKIVASVTGDTLHAATTSSARYVTVR